jgi:ubiquinone/menaquinone biosynthesis C-methylase UbiE
MEMDVNKFDGIAREVFAPAYKAIARQIKETTGVTQGLCLDAGAGGGYLSLAMAEITDLNFVVLDKMEEMRAIAAENIIKAGFEKRMKAIAADIQEIPLDDNSIDIVISRGSVFFWEDKSKAFREIYRVLAPGGGYLYRWRFRLREAEEADR